MPRSVTPDELGALDHGLAEEFGGFGVLGVHRVLW